MTLLISIPITMIISQMASYYFSYYSTGLSYSTIDLIRTIAALIFVIGLYIELLSIFLCYLPRE